MAPLFGQESLHNYLRQAQEAYDAGNYEEAAATYQKAFENYSDSPKASYNLGESLYRQEKFEQAADYFKKSAELAPSDEFRADAYHNLGNTQLKQQQLKQAVDSYKSALRYRPNDQETMNNLSQALRLLQQQQQQQEQQKQEQQENEEEQQEQEQQEQKQDEQNEDQQKEEQPQEPQNNQEPEEQEEQEQGEQEENPIDKEPEDRDLKPEELSQEEVERLLKIMENEEQKVQEKLHKGNYKTSSPDKDW